MTRCRRLFVPRDVCYVRFVRGKIGRQVITSDDVGHTVRGEMVVADYDKKGAILGF